MGGKSSPSPPPAPDPQQLIQAQSAANNTSQYTPFGSNTFNQVYDTAGQPTGQWEQHIQLNPLMQGQLNNTQLGGLYASGAGLNSLGQALQNYSQPYTGSGLPQWQSSLGPNSNPFGTGQQQMQIQGSVPGAGQAQQHISTQGVNGVNPQSVDANQFDINSYFNRVYSPMESQINKNYDRQQGHQDARLAAQGINLGSDAYREAQNIMGENRNDALTRAESAAYGQALGASQNAFGQQLGAAQNNFGQNLSANQNQFGQNLAQGNFYNYGQGQNFGQNMAAGQFGNQAQAQQFGQNLGGSLANAQLNNSVIPQQMQQELALYNLPFQQAQGLFGMNPMQSPNFSGSQPANVLGAYGLNQQAQQNAYNQQMANYGSNQSGKFNMLGAGLQGAGSFFGGG